MVIVMVTGVVTRLGMVMADGRLLVNGSQDIDGLLSCFGYSPRYLVGVRRVGGGEGTAQ